MRYVLLDRITALRAAGGGPGVKCVSLADDVFVDHFPGHPVMPGALILESLAQLGGVLLEATMRTRGRWICMRCSTMVERAKFRRLVRPGDKLQLEARASPRARRVARCGRRPRVDGAARRRGRAHLCLRRGEDTRLIARRREVLNVWLHGSSEEP